jgi:hypothetical protein
MSDPEKRSVGYWNNLAPNDIMFYATGLLCRVMEAGGAASIMPTVLARKIHKTCHKFGGCYPCVSPIDKIPK